jgi:dolichyl-phosphate beta-glucosyltransferase
VTSTHPYHNPYLSIVIPAHNEAGRLPSTLERLNAYLSTQPYTWEIIVVSNASTDNTEEVVRQAARTMPHLYLMNIAERGKGIAAKVGALESCGDFVFLCDADMSMPPAEIESFLQVSTLADIVVGSREGPGARRIGEPSHRHIMGRVFNGLVRLLAVPGLDDTQCGFKLFRRGVARRLFELQTVNGFGFDVELLYLARKTGYTVHEVPIEWHFDSDTRVRAGIDTVNMLTEVVMIRLRDFTGHYGSHTRVTASE